jgi:hypothetical protein
MPLLQSKERAGKILSAARGDTMKEMAMTKGLEMEQFGG